MTLHVCKHSNLLCSVIFVNFYNFSTMTSLCRHVSVVSTGNCKLGHDCRRVCSHHRHDATRQFRRVGVGGVYWTLDGGSAHDDIKWARSRGNSASRLGYRAMTSTGHVTSWVTSPIDSACPRSYRLSAVYNPLSLVIS